MPLIRPFTGLRPDAVRTAEVIAPPYDVLSTEEARLRARDRPWSFLHVSRAEIDLPEGTDAHAPAVYAQAAQNFRRMQAEGVLVRDPQPCFYIYRLVMDGHAQFGVVAAVAAQAYDSGRIKRHEFTRPDKEDDRVHHIEALDAQTGPVLLAHPASDAIRDIAWQVTARAPEADVTAYDGVSHALWAVRDAPGIARLGAAFDAMPALYIADGHHRSAAASRVAAARRAANPQHTGEESYNRFLAVIFPQDQMRIFDYNRVVRDLNGLGVEGFLSRLGERFSVQAESGCVRPHSRGEFGLYVAGHWYRLRIRAELIPACDPVARLDVSLLSEHLLAPVLGITDLRRDKRIDFVGGIRGTEELERRVDSGEMAAAFSLHPTSMDDLVRVSDSGQVMPPKSTWFEPKLADGLVSHMLD